MVAKLSRRRLLVTAVSIGGTIGCIAIARAGESGDAGQLGKNDVQYQAAPKGGQRCDRCSNFVAPSGCKVVTGAISANGWCLLFKPRP
jgi:hypothetical protein